MKLGLGLHRQQFDFDHYRFARQCGCTHLMLHLATVSRPSGHRIREAAPAPPSAGLRATEPTDDLWTYESLARLTEDVNAADLQVGAVHHFDPVLPSDGRIKGAGQKRWLDRFKTIIRNVGSMGIPVFCYEVALPGTGGRAEGFARGDAGTFAVDAPPEPTGSGSAARRSPRELAESLTNRWEKFLQAVLPVAGEAGVALAARFRAPDLSRKIVDLPFSTHHALDFCVADVAAAVGDGVYAALETCLREKRIASLRVSNVRAGLTPPDGTFADDGDIDVLRIVRILKLGGYTGMIVPEQAPQMHCAAPWHAGMAHTLGYLQAASQSGGTTE